MCRRMILRFIFAVFRWLRGILMRFSRSRKITSPGAIELGNTSPSAEVLSRELETVKKALLITERKASDAEAASEANATRARELEKQLQDERDQAQNALTQAERERAYLQQKLDEHASHLKQLNLESVAAQKWMSIRDTVTDTQVVDAVSGINHEINNIAATLAESLTTMEHSPSAFRDHIPASFRTHLSDHAAAALDSVIHREDPSLLEIVITAILVGFACEASLRWNIVGDVALQCYLEKIFEALFDGEISAIAGNWKALTHRYINWQDSSDEQVSHKDDGLYKAFLALLVPFALVWSSDHTNAVTMLESCIGDSLSSLSLSVKKLNYDITEGITSCALIPTVVAPDLPYDPSVMKDGSGGGDESSIEGASMTLCTTGLGLRRRMRTDGGSVEDKLLVLPTVALRGVLDFFASSAISHDTSSLNY
ncbi:hypothetical protein K488DRAFT_71651 [Vararia minispora EC-137]|uniref:Uncharacterized protein n=1 Tax=Vararia minispora EC-137 TaxID=1314806 RepID=A0ACB8QHK5_9AGAM|nr:hypothetical protein K488DRAFT_71651 [Vararia minispora EC-137]